MDLVTLIAVVLFLCLLLWVVNASGWMQLPPPFIWFFNALVLLCFVLMVLHVSGVWNVHSIRLGAPV